MKKIFTLIAMALMAVGANAQTPESFIPTVGTTYTGLQEVSTTNCKLVFGDDTYSAAAAKSHKAYIKSIGLSTTEAEEGKDRYVLVSGKNNPNDNIPYTKEDGTQISGSAYSPDKKNLPAKGAYYTLTPSKAGKMIVGIILNPDKAFYIVKKSTCEPLAISDVTLTVDGDTPASETYNENYTTANKVTGTASFDVVANETYYVFSNGSKLGFFGYVFTPSSTDGIAGVKVAAEQNAPAYNLAGQKVDKSYKGVVIQNGKKMIQK